MCLTISVSAQAQKPEEVVTVPKSMLNTAQLQELANQDLQKKIEMYGDWVGKGEEIGKAVDGSLKAITSNAVSLSETKLGKFTMFLVAWKVIGTDVIQLGIGLLLMLIFFPLFILSYWRTCIPRRVLIEDGPEAEKKKWQILNPSDDMDTNHQRIGHAVALVIWIAINSAILFF
jgi:hypothetical protein